MANLIFSITIPPIIWLLYGGPSLVLVGNLAVFAWVTFHLLAVIWQRQLFALFRGDAFTYGVLARALNGIALTAALVAGGIVFLVYGGDIETLASIPKFIWAFMLISILFTILFPVMSSRDVTPLSTKADRREYENPGDSV